MWNFFSKDPSKELVNFEVQEPVTFEGDLQNKTIWSINNAKKKGATASSGSVSQPGPNELLYSVFSCQAKPGNEQAITAAKNAYRRTKTLRHPNILLFQDGVDSDKAVYIVTERVQPLASYLRESKDNESQKENEISWGLYQIATALSFLNTDCKIIHNNVNLASVVVNRAGEWKLTGFEFAHGIDDSHTPYKCLPSLDCYEPPERSPVSNLKSAPSRDSNSIEQLHAADSWGLGCLIWEIFNGFLPNLNALKNPGHIPKRLIPAYSELLNSQPNRRLNAAKFITHCRQPNGFMSNHFVDTLLFLEEIQIKDQNEKSKFFQDLTEKLDDFPGQLCRFKILPQLLSVYEFGNAGSTILPPLFKLGKSLEDSEYQKKIIPIVVKLFSSTDRATRMRLLQQLHLFIEHLSASIINDQIFPHICAGFTDTNPAIRESTIRSMVLLAPKLNYNNLNVELMKHFARLQAQDDQGMIRTNTTVCIGKIAPYINPQLRQRILLSAFPKAMRDPFPLARLSGLIAMANTDRFYTLKDIATRVLPCLCALTVDPEKDVRDEAFRTIKTFMLKLEKVSETPETALELEKDVQACNLDVKNETSWTSWAVTSLSAKMSAYKGKNVQPSIALNTQPLNNPAGSLAATGAAASGATDKKPDETASKPKPSAASLNPQQQQQQREEDKSSSFSSFPAGNSSSGATGGGGGGGWADFDDNEWKDLDDDPMEPFEPFESPAAAKTTTTTTSKATSKPNNDWSSDWSSSFDTTAAIEPIKAVKSDPKLPGTNSYNWASPSSNKNSGFVDDKTKNEEELFSSLVKDVSISSSNKPSASNKGDWGDNWNDVFENTPTREAKQRPQRKTTTADGGESKPKSGPLKLGQKKPQDFF